MNKKTYIPWLQSILLLLSFGIAGYALAMYGSAQMPTEGFVSGKMYYDHFKPDNTWLFGLLLHIFCGSLALISGGLQWVVTRTRLRKNHHSGFVRFHRINGIVYVASIGLAFVGAIIMVPSAMGGIVSVIGFLTLDLLWLGSTIMSVVFALKKDLVQHRAWMIRSFALTSAAITLRIYLPLSGLLGLDFIVSYQVIAWLCWVPNLFVAQILIKNRPRLSTEPLGS